VRAECEGEKQDEGFHEDGLNPISGVELVCGEFLTTDYADYADEERTPKRD
jgi:hypothetical protein